MNIVAQLWFDTEDFITPEADDALLLLLKMLKRRNCPATFKIVGEKARVLRRRGREDILELLKGFSIGYHTDYHSVHPTIAELCKPLSFKEGCEAYYYQDLPGLLDVEQIVGKKCYCFGQPGSSWASQTYPALLKMGIPMYMDSHSIINGDERPFWYGGMLNYLDIDISSDHRVPLKEDGMEVARRRFAYWKEQHSNEPISFMNIYYHPCEFSCTKFYDLNFAKGVNPLRYKWQHSPLRPEKEMQMLVELVGEYVDFLRQQGVTFTVPEEFMGMEKSKKGEVSIEVVRAWAEKAALGNLDSLVMGGYSISCSEGLALVANALAKRPLTAPLVYGPDSANGVYHGHGEAEEVLKAVLNFLDTDEPLMQLPVEFTADNTRISPVGAAIALSRKLIFGEDRSETMLRGFLKPADRVNPSADWSGWPIHTEDFTAHEILALARQQMWTYKPAIF